MSAFSRADYEGLLYSVADRYAQVASSTLHLYPNSESAAFVHGSVYFRSGLELRVFEYLDLTDGELLDYSYAIYRGEEKIRWYDSQPHPDNPDLASTFPHHRHEPPGIKQNRRHRFTPTRVGTTKLVPKTLYVESGSPTRVWGK
jgi:hypothetical protein